MSFQEDEEKGTELKAAHARIHELELALAGALDERERTTTLSLASRRNALLRTRLIIAERECAYLRNRLSNETGAAASSRTRSSWDEAPAHPRAGVTVSLDVDPRRGWPLRVAPISAPAAHSAHSFHSSHSSHSPHSSRASHASLPGSAATPRSGSSCGWCVVEDGLLDLLACVERCSVRADSGLEPDESELIKLANLLHGTVISLSSLPLLRHGSFYHSTRDGSSFSSPRGDGGVGGNRGCRHDLAEPASFTGEGRLVGHGSFEQALSLLLPPSRSALLSVFRGRNSQDVGAKNTPRGPPPKAGSKHGSKHAAKQVQPAVWAAVEEMWARCIWARDVVRARERAVSAFLEAGGAFDSIGPAWDNSTNVDAAAMKEARARGWQ